MASKILTAALAAAAFSYVPAMAQQPAGRPVLHGPGQAMSRPDQPVGTAGQLRSRPDMPTGGLPDAVPGVRPGGSAGVAVWDGGIPPAAVTAGPPAGSGQAYPDGPH